MGGAEYAVALFIALGIVAAGAIRMAMLHVRLRTLEEQAITDPLTGAFNRRHLDASLASAIARQNRTGERASLLLFDVDCFKAINDALGHAAGDRVLKALVALASHRARKIDAVFRTGGEEFAVLLSGARFKDALLVAENLRALVADAPLVDGQAVSISVGVCELREGQSVHEWFDEADAALYRAKRGGRNRVAGRHAVCARVVTEPPLNLTATR